MTLFPDDVDSERGGHAEPPEPPTIQGEDDAWPIAAAQQSLSSPRLPLELSGLVIEQLSESGGRADLLSCSLVCHGWLHFSRHHLTMRIRSKNAAEFAVFTPLETATMPSTIRHLDISRDQIIVDILPRFKYLRSLKIFYLASQLPCLPSLIELTLTNCHFSSYSSFMGILSAVPSLRNLVLIGLTLSPSDDDRYQLSTRDLDSLYLAWSPDEFRRLIPFRTRRLTLEPPFDVSSDESSISRYLRHLGGYLTYLHLVLHGMLMDPRTQRGNEMSKIDLTAIVRLRHLRISHLDISCICGPLGYRTFSGTHSTRGRADHRCQ
ncbi:hypothetical protein B0H14DRAFT_2566427 [Mycena olivaceomarginata]|nr:hypothetical protein B0H14DRAFT_2566427 [Mycena olivaceomarginata]